MNTESAIAVLFILSLVLVGRFSHDEVRETVPRRPLWWRQLPVLALLLVVLPFLIAIRAPLLYDAYAHVLQASRETWEQLLTVFYQHPTAGDFFFRPLGYLDYWLEAKWAGFSFAIWQVDGILLHVIACTLLYRLARRLSLFPAGALVAVLLFGLYGGNPEVVTWTAARFDEICVCFVLAALLFFCEYFLDGKARLTWMLVAALCAMLSKEAAFCLPALAACVIVYRGSRFDRRAWRAIASLTILEIAFLAYRGWVLRGVGGYGAESGDPLVFHFSWLHLLELLCFRMWSVLLFPVNWSVSLEWWAVVGMVVGLIGLSLLIAFCRPSLRQVSAAIAFCWMALLPASPLGLLDATMLGTRVYHLAVIGIALLFGAVADTVRQGTVRAVAIGSVLVLQSSVLCHNLFIWRDTAQLAGSVCRSFGSAVHSGDPVVVEGLPRERHGVFFLANGFSACVYVNSGKRVSVLPIRSKSSGSLHFRWDDVLQRLVAAGGGS